MPQLSCYAIFPPIAFLNALKNDPDDPKLNSFARFNASLPSDCSTATSTPITIAIAIAIVQGFDFRTIVARGLSTKRVKNCWKSSNFLDWRSSAEWDGA